MRYRPYAHVFHREDGYYIAARSKSGLINKVKALARKGDADGGALLYEGDSKYVFGEVIVGGPDNEIVKYKRR